MSSVIKKAFRDSRFTVLWLAIGFGIYAILILAFYPSIVKEKDQFQEIMDSYPEEFMAVFLGDTDVDITNPGTYVHAEFNSFFILILGAFLTYQVFNAITNAERDGSMDMMMSLPISRREMLLARMVNAAVSTFLVLTAACLAFILGRELFPEFAVGVGDLMAGFYSAFFLLMAHVAFVFFLVSVIPSRMKLAGPIAYTTWVGAYLLNGFSSLADVIHSIRFVFLFNYYNISDVINNGFDVGNMLVLSAIALAFGAAAWYFIDQKELGV